MNIENEISSFEFQALDVGDSDIIKNGFIHYAALLNIDDAKDQWIDTAAFFEEILEDEPTQPETVRDILEFLSPFESVAEGESVNIFKVKKFEEFESYYTVEPLLIAVIEVLYKNIDERFEIEGFLEELIDLSYIISKSY